MKKIIWIFIALLLLVLGTGIYLVNMPQKRIDAQSIDVNMNATALYKNYIADEALGNKNYIDKILLIEGKIREISKDEMEASVFLLAENGASGGVLCTFEKNQNTSKYKVGDKVIVKGKCTGMLMDVVLNKCILQ